ncbi:DUF6346 domain-containing protein [Saccharopolyspora sp. MS10]|uniref:DUF6346 domain-containing protein n=1 Tax=Saccharopolyspora sp. MS10 TaxID=3385973 RepID=UPI0039A1521B
MPLSEDTPSGARARQQPAPEHRVSTGWRIGRLAAEIVVRLLVLLVFHTTMGATGITTTDGVPTERGTARATDCERAGPVSMSGLGFWWTCEATVTWADGRSEQRTFKFSDLTPDNRTAPAPVERRELDNRGSNVVIADAGSFAPLGWALFVPLLGLAFVGVRLPIPPRGPDPERRGRARLAVWPPALLAAGWWLVIAGGLGHGRLAVLTWLPVVVIVAGHALLAVGAGFAINRRRHGYPEFEPPVRVGGRLFRANLLLTLGILGLGLGLVSGQEPLGIAALTALPVAALGLGARSRLVVRRIQAEQQAL